MELCVDCSAARSFFLASTFSKAVFGVDPEKEIYVLALGV
jgi:hypothetical protein